MNLIETYPTFSKQYRDGKLDCSYGVAVVAGKKGKFGREIFHIYNEEQLLEAIKKVRDNEVYDRGWIRNGKYHPTCSSYLTKIK